MLALKRDVGSGRQPVGTVDASQFLQIGISQKTSDMCVDGFPVHGSVHREVAGQQLNCTMAVLLSQVDSRQAAVGSIIVFEVGADMEVGVRGKRPTLVELGQGFQVGTGDVAVDNNVYQAVRDASADTDVAPYHAVVAEQVGIYVSLSEAHFATNVVECIALILETVDVGLEPYARFGRKEVGALSRGSDSARERMQSLTG